MDTLIPEVYAGLQATGKNVEYFYPSKKRGVPVITYFESNNRVFTRADGAEYATEVEYTVDIWDTTSESTSAIALLVDTQMSALGLTRTFSFDLVEGETGMHHKNMRYRGLIHIGQQRIYQ